MLMTFEVIKVYMLYFEQDVNFPTIFNYEKFKSNINTCCFYISM